MPPTVRVAVVASCILTLLGGVAFALWMSHLLAGDSACAALGLCGAQGLLSIGAMAAVVPVAAVRRDARLREAIFQGALLVALLVGFVALAALALGLSSGLDATLAVPVVMFVLAAVLAWALSRPSAKAWFTSGRVGRTGPA